MALSKPTNKEKGQWYFQRYIKELPNHGEIVLFDRSWYNRAIVEPVMGFCNDQELLKVNQEFLSHDNLTDIITFDYSDPSGIMGEVLISTEMVKDNALDFDQLFDVELRRVMVHGVLHLCGYKDKSDDEKILMTKKEDFYLSRYV